MILDYWCLSPYSDLILSNTLAGISFSVLRLQSTACATTPVAPNYAVSHFLSFISVRPVSLHCSPGIFPFLMKQNFSPLPRGLVANSFVSSLSVDILLTTSVKGPVHPFHHDLFVFPFSFAHPIWIPIHFSPIQFLCYRTLIHDEKAKIKLVFKFSWWFANSFTLPQTWI